MTLLEYVAMRVGHPVDLDGWYGPQCTDLVNDYVKRVYGVGPLLGNAVDFQHARPPGFQWVPNGPQNAPGPGSVVVWGGPLPVVGLSAAGHCAVALLADGMDLLTLDQNWPTTHAPQTVSHTYAGVVGWLTPTVSKV